MTIDENNVTEWTSDLDNIYSILFQRFEISSASILKTLEECDSFYDLISQPSVRRDIVEKLSFEEWSFDFKVVKKCCKISFENKTLIHRIFEAIECVMDFIHIEVTNGSINDFSVFCDFEMMRLFNNLADSFLEILVFIEITMANCIKIIQKIYQKFRRVSLL